MQVRDIMTQPVITANVAMNLDEVARLLLTHNIGGLPVVDSAGRLCGIVTESDFTAKEHGVPFSTLKLPQLFHEWLPKEGIERLYAKARTLTVSEIMSPQVISLTETDSVEHAVRLLLQHEVHRLPVVRDGKPIGMVSRHDLLKVMAKPPSP